MTRLWNQRALIVVGFLITVAAVSAAVWRYGYLQALDQLAQRGQADLDLASDRLTGQLQGFQEIAVLLADHPVLQALAIGRETAAAKAMLLAAADKTAALDILFVSPAGQVVASAHDATLQDVSQNAAIWWHSSWSSASALSRTPRPWWPRSWPSSASSVAGSASTRSGW